MLHAVQRECVVVNAHAPTKFALRCVTRYLFPLSVGGSGASSSTTMRILSFLGRVCLIVGLPICIAIVIVRSYAMTFLSEPARTALVAEKEVGETIEAVGILLSDPETPVRFTRAGNVSEVLVQEGDRVMQGQELAIMQSETGGAGSTNASVAVQAARAQLAALQRGARPEDMGVLLAQEDAKRVELTHAQAKLQTAEDALRTATATQESPKTSGVVQEADVQAASSAITAQYATAIGALANMQAIFGRLDVQDALAKNVAGEGLLLREADMLRSTMNAQASRAQAMDARTALDNLRIARSSVSDASQVLREAVLLFEGLQLTEHFDEDGRERAVIALNGAQSQVQAALSVLDASIERTQFAAAHPGMPSVPGSDWKQVEWQLSAERARDEAQAQIASIEAELRIIEAQKLLKNAPASPSDIAAAETRLRQALGGLAQASGRGRGTPLLAPTDGTVLRVNLLAGQLSPLTEPAIVLRPEAERSVLVYIPDIDLARIGPGSTATVAFHAHPGIEYQLRIDGARGQSKTVNGVDGYRRMEFAYPHPELGVGLTGSVRIVTGERRQMVTVPMDSIERDVDGTTFVRVLSGEEITRRRVVLGREDETGFMEVIEGLDAGESVVVQTSKNVSYLPQ